MRIQQVANHILQISYLHANPVVIISLIQYRSLRGKNRNKLFCITWHLSIIKASDPGEYAIEL